MHFHLQTHYTGIDTSSVQLVSFDGLRGVAASRPIAEGTALLQVPFKNALAVTPVSRCTLPESFCSKACWDKQPPVVRMALILLYERSLGAASRFHPWIRMLPNEFTTVLHWSAQDMEMLGYPQAATLRERRIREFDGYYNSIKQLQPGTPVAKDDLKWALDCIQSRLFSGPYSGRSLQSRIQLAGFTFALAVAYVLLGLGTPENALNAVISVLLFNLVYDQVLSKKLTWYATLPMIDMINHKTGAKADVSYQYFTDNFSVELGDTYATGQQLFITYGDKSNDQLLVYYGFAEPENLNDSYVMSSGLNEAVKAAAGVGSLRRTLDEVVITRSGITALSMESICEAVGVKGDSAEAKVIAKKLLATELRRVEAVDASRSRAALQSDEKEGIAAAFRSSKRILLHQAISVMGGFEEAEKSKGFTK